MPTKEEISVQETALDEVASATGKGQKKLEKAKVNKVPLKGTVEHRAQESQVKKSLLPVKEKKEKLPDQKAKEAMSGAEKVLEDLRRKLDEKKKTEIKNKGFTKSEGQVQSQVQKFQEQGYRKEWCPSFGVD